MKAVCLAPSAKLQPELVFIKELLREITDCNCDRNLFRSVCCIEVGVVEGLVPAREQCQLDRIKHRGLRGISGANQTDEVASNPPIQVLDSPEMMNLKLMNPHVSPASE